MMLTPSDGDRGAVTNAVPDLDVIVQLPEQPDLPAALTVAKVLTTSADVLSARRLQAEVFLARGFAAAEHLAADGTLVPSVARWLDRSTWVGVLRDGHASAVARQIHLPRPGDLPALALPGADPARRAAIAAMRPGSVVEISALARRPDAPVTDTLAVYRSLYLLGLRARHEVWVMALDLHVFDLLRTRVCGDAVRALGPAVPYLGSPTVPAVLRLADVPGAVRALAGGDPRLEVLPRLFPEPRLVPAPRQAPGDPSRAPGGLVR